MSADLILSIVCCVGCHRGFPMLNSIDEVFQPLFCCYYLFWIGGQPTNQPTNHQHNIDRADHCPLHHHHHHRHHLYGSHSGIKMCATAAYSKLPARYRYRFWPRPTIFCHHPRALKYLQPLPLSHINFLSIFFFAQIWMMMMTFRYLMRINFFFLLRLFCASFCTLCCYPPPPQLVHRTPIFIYSLCVLLDPSLCVSIICCRQASHH